ncbi:multicopper oxidase domain-containing protein [Actinomycetospora termitidis]|uniref:Multicopper oxidase domain-containing protein n=1 Tax=Actinomycetospora termitidis TaxID=3053470 RepID=A0ABT7MGW3_9PSEU|nr:multicopper oxidase domain-containing protein [Actinomycetospora sp. Odt1-22]MDL5159921.1 multicopper oxidase domain-containing protein [Actinomycetospora sp. Odt1-22]
MSKPIVEVVALSVPIVYTNDGDHDPNGMLYTLSGYEPLIRWLRDRWNDREQRLPRLHRRRDLAQMVVDGLDRYAAMVEILERKSGPERDLLRDRTAKPPVEEQEPDPTRGDTDPRLLAVRQNYHATVTEILAALGELTGREVEELAEEESVRTVWREQWAQAVVALDAQIRGLLDQVDESFDRALPGLVAASGMSRRRVRRLLLNDHRTDVRGLGDRTPPYDRVNPMRPVPVIRPLVLRACRGDELIIRFRNEIADRAVGLHLQGDGPVDPMSDGSHVGTNPSSLRRRGDPTLTLRWRCDHEGVWPINDLGDVRGDEQGTNAHGLFAALVVEPEGATWSDPETGETISGTAWSDGPDVDVHVAPQRAPRTPFGEFPSTGPDEDHREFTVFIHDEPEVHSAFHLVAEHTVMPLSYRAEPMPNRLPHHMRRLVEATSAEPPPGQVGVDRRAFGWKLDDELGEVFRTARTPDGRWLELIAGEEQHHSSWLFGDPVTPIFRAYRGDPARVRLVHAGVKETHVFHLHVHQWRAVAEDPTSQLLDSVTIGPQTAVTIDPLYGSGSRQHALGDIIWHCHLYPHFHHGMWGLWRSFDRIVDAVAEPDPEVTGGVVYPDGRYIAHPDGSPCHPLQPLPGRTPPPRTATLPGFPWFIDAQVPSKAPPPPAVIDAHVGGRRRLLELPAHSALEYEAFAPGVKAKRETGALFVDLDGQAAQWDGRPWRVLSYDVAVREEPVEYNSHGWHDPHGHRYELMAVEVREGGNVERMALPETRQDGSVEPFFPRANHGDIVELRLHNELGTLPPDHFDLTALPVECGLHVHLVKFDVLAADGSSTGWNYLSGASCTEAVGPNRPGEPARNVSFHRWVVDEEFGPCFFHDHLLANYRQKRGLFAALIAEPRGSDWFTPDRTARAWVGAQAVVVPPDEKDAYREACLGIGDFIPLYDRSHHPLNAPNELGSDNDPGVMGVNYRNAPLRERGKDPSSWFASRVARPDEEEPEAVGGDPDTPIIGTYPGDRLRVRLIQGSHEEQHSFVTHGLRWRHEWKNPTSRLVDQQTLGISEAFTLDISQENSPYGPGDHLWRCAAIDDLWLGCWGLVRVHTPGARPLDHLPTLPGREWADVRATRAVPERPQPQYPAVPSVGPRPPYAWATPRARTYVVAACREEIEYADALSDPWGLRYVEVDGWDPEIVDGRPTGRIRARGGRADDPVEPLVLRARAGEWVRVVLINELFTRPSSLAESPIDPLLPPFGPETNPPAVPLDVERTVSPRVSLHAGLVRYDVVTDDGAWVGGNHDGTVPPLGAVPGEHGGHAVEAEKGGVARRTDHAAAHDRANWAEYWWYADPLLDDRVAGQVCHLQDMADVRNHRHHGLVGALVVEPADATPRYWTGSRTAVFREGHPDVAEQVLVVQDGLRLFLGGRPTAPLPDMEEGDAEDAGQKGINYRTALVGRRGLAVEPVTPVWEVEPEQELWLRLVGGCDKPRNHTWTVHGHAWTFAPWTKHGPWVGALSGLTAGWVRDLVLTAAKKPGDYAYRSGAFRHAVVEGLWGILRVRSGSPSRRRRR